MSFISIWDKWSLGAFTVEMGNWREWEIVSAGRHAAKKRLRVMRDSFLHFGFYYILYIVVVVALYFNIIFFICSSLIKKQINEMHFINGQLYTYDGNLVYVCGGNGRAVLYANYSLVWFLVGVKYEKKVKRLQTTTLNVTRAFTYT